MGTPATRIATHYPGKLTLLLHWIPGRLWLSGQCDGLVAAGPGFNSHCHHVSLLCRAGHSAKTAIKIPTLHLSKSEP